MRVFREIGVHRAYPTAQRANANPAAATDLASVITLANELRAALVEKGGDQGRGLIDRAVDLRPFPVFAFPGRRGCASYEV